MHLITETEGVLTPPILLNYGGADKAINEMNEAELQTAQADIQRRAKEKAFSKGLPIHYVLNGKAVAEYADGRIEVTEP